MAIKIFGPDLKTLNDPRRPGRGAGQQCPATRTSTPSRTTACNTWRVVVDRLAAGRYGLSVEEVQDALRVQIEGRAGTVIDGNRASRSWYAGRTA